ncbi:MAG: hypothetical protein HQ517_12160, partial [SAR324 cluster bacterium]|nr:hypothetical protein [SAR324 cluster bacterium]
YALEGEYMGYSSRETSFPDNYIEVNHKAYQTFLKKSLQSQEQQIFDTLIESSDVEFFSSTPFSLLDGFNSYGCGTGILPTLNFPEIRRFLFDLLKNCQSDVWYSTASLIRYLKTHHPFFLIPEKPKGLKRWELENWRYGNFSERQGHEYGRGISITEADSDAFERVEGRYVERFLERIPLTLG